MSELKRPPVPHANATRKALAALRAMSPAEAEETFVRSGILTSDGKLAPAYGGESAPSRPSEPKS